MNFVNLRNRSPNNGKFGIEKEIFISSKSSNSKSKIQGDNFHKWNDKVTSQHDTVLNQFEL